MASTRRQKLTLDWTANVDPGPLTGEERAYYDQLLQWWIEKAKKGDTGCQFDLGVKFFDGVFVPIDYNKAFDWLRRAAEAGHIEALVLFASLYCLGLGVDQNYELAFKLFMKAAEAGSLVAQYELARMYREGVGTEVSPQKAFQWVYAAACNPDEKKRFSKTYHERIGEADSVVNAAVFERDDLKADAQYEAAEALSKGLVVEQNLLLAKGWYEAAAKRGHGLAQCELGMFLARGIGDRDMISAVSWWEQAARNGVGQGALNAAYVYLRGDGVVKNLEKAEEWARVAAEAGISHALIFLGNLEIENARNPDGIQRAKKLYLQAVRTGDVVGQYSVGVACHRLGIMMNDDGLIEESIASHKEALLWFYLAEENGSEHAPEMISFVERGLGMDLVRQVKGLELKFRQLLANGEVGLFKIE